MTVIEVNATLRLMLQVNRRNTGLTQEEAARLTGISTSWWKKLESGRRTTADEETLAQMLHTVGVQPTGTLPLPLHEGVAKRLLILSVNPHEDTETYLMKTPHTSYDEKAALVVYLRSLRQAYATRMKLSKSNAL
jgi:transcriptional regulator with XRE-family HTH domain